MSAHASFSRNPQAATILFAAAILVPAFAATLAAQQPAPAKPPLIHWQRTLRDALLLAKLKKLPLLVVANQDGEIACDTLANNQYRSPAFAKLVNRYVAVIASPDRHNPQDYDSSGNRILCPRFGCVTCGEHIAIEPGLFARYFKGNRVAPRHIGIGVDGKEKFDRFLDRSLQDVEDSIRANAEQKAAMPDLRSADRSLDGLVRSAADVDRRVVEARFASADKSKRLAILAAATKSGIEQEGLVRMGVRSREDDVRRAAHATFVETATADSLLLTLQLLGAAHTAAEHTHLLRVLVEPAKSDDTWKRALVIRRALGSQSTVVDPTKWRAYVEKAGGKTGTDVVANEELSALDGRIDANTKRARAGDAGGHLWMEIARDTFRYALNRIQGSKDPTFLLQDADSAARRAVANEFTAAEAAPLRARLLWLLNRPKDAGTLAALALAGDPPALARVAGTPTAAAVLEIYARDRVRVVQSERPQDADYPAEAVTDAHRAYEALTQNPWVEEKHAKAHIDLLLYLGARWEAGRAIRRGLGRFPTSANLHEYFRNHALWTGGHGELETAYDGYPTDDDNRAAITWFAGYATLIAAEGHVRTGGRGADRKAAATAAHRAYQKTIDRFESSGKANPAFRDSARHYVALAHGGRAKLLLDAGQLEPAVTAVLLGSAARPATFKGRDGLGNSLERTTRRLLRRLQSTDAAALAKRLRDGLERLGLR